MLVFCVWCFVLVILSRLTSLSTCPLLIDPKVFIANPEYQLKRKIKTQYAFDAVYNKKVGDTKLSHYW